MNLDLVKRIIARDALAYYWFIQDGSQNQRASGQECRFPVWDQ